MKKHIILSVNANPDYLYFVPICCWAWQQFGWEPVLFFNGDLPDDLGMLVTGPGAFNFHVVKDVPGYRSDTITQVSRLYAGCAYRRGAYLMTGDIDMIPLSDYWHPANGKPTVWGHDLTGYTHYPICYIGMSSEYWVDVMSLRQEGEINKDYNELIKRDLDTLPQAKDPDFYKYWFSDQDLITKRLKPFKPTIINRGQYPNGYARGRVDRGAWTLDHKEFIDAHLHHQIHHKQNDWKFQQTLELLRKIWPEENFDWYIEYHNEFKRLTGHS